MTGQSSPARVTVQQREFLIYLSLCGRCGTMEPEDFNGRAKPRSAGTFYPEITRSSAAAVLRRLEKRGLVCRVGRRSYRLTDAGRDVLTLRPPAEG